MHEVTIRGADRADLEALIIFNAAMAWETEHKQLDPTVLRAGITRLLAEPALGRYIVAVHQPQTHQNEIVGALMLTSEWSDWRNGLFWWIQSVYIRPQFRRTGVYRALHEHTRAQARTVPDVCGIRLYVERENVNAQQTYLAMGMEETVYRIYEETFAARG